MAESKISCDIKRTTLSGTTKANGEIDIGTDLFYIPVGAKIISIASQLSAFVDFRISVVTSNYYILRVRDINGDAIANTNVEVEIIWIKA